jgi:hypothetical protein
MNLPTLLLTIPAESGSMFLAMFLITMMVAFPLRMEKRRK